MRYGERLIKKLWDRKELEKQTLLDFAAVKKEPSCTETLQAEGIQISVCVDNIDRFGLLLHSFELTLTEEAAADGITEKIEELVNQICEKIPYLDGQFHCVEMDRKGQDAVLRTEPTKDAEKSYYELEILAGREARIRYFTMSNDLKQRKASPANISIETLRRLTDQLIEVFRFAHIG